MVVKVINTTIKLRRDNDYNYNKVSEKFVPAYGEVCFVDTARKGLMVKVGDGVTKFGALEFANEIFVRAYYNEADNKFYKDEEYTEEIIGNSNRIYIDEKNVNSIYYYNGVEYSKIGAGSLPGATAEVPGIMKLYNEKGNNTDGAISQFAFTQEINKKIEMEIEPENEKVIFGYNLK